MSQREALDGSAVPFVAGGTVIVVLVRVWTYLNAAERQLCTWIDIAESVRTDKRIDVVGRCLRCRNLSGGVMLAGCRTRKCGKHGERNYYFLYLHYCHCLFSLSLDVAHSHLIFVPQCVHRAVFSEDVLYGTVPRPWHHFESGAIKLA